MTHGGCFPIDLPYTGRIAIRPPTPRERASAAQNIAAHIWHHYPRARDMAAELYAKARQEMEIE